VRASVYVRRNRRDGETRALAQRPQREANVLQRGLDPLRAAGIAAIFFELLDSAEL
jgi:hypothetical protein